MTMAKSQRDQRYGTEWQQHTEDTKSPLILLAESTCGFWMCGKPEKLESIFEEPIQSSWRVWTLFGKSQKAPRTAWSAECNFKNTKITLATVCSSDQRLRGSCNGSPWKPGVVLETEKLESRDRNTRKHMTQWLKWYSKAETRKTMIFFLTLEDQKKEKSYWGWKMDSSGWDITAENI